MRAFYPALPRDRSHVADRTDRNARDFGLAGIGAEARQAAHCIPHPGQMKASLNICTIVVVALMGMAASAGAQQPVRIPRIGVIPVGEMKLDAPEISAFEQGLRDLGYVKGKTIAIEYRLPEVGRPGASDTLAAELVRR